jgi:hypothetical protein
MSAAIAVRTLPDNELGSSAAAATPASTARYTFGRMAMDLAMDAGRYHWEGRRVSGG